MIKKLKVKVTLKNINEGRVGSPQFCPIAMALKALGYIPIVSSGNVFVKDKDGIEWDGLLPAQARNFITKFDTHRFSGPNRKFRAFSFDLKLIKV